MHLSCAVNADLYKGKPLHPAEPFRKCAVNQRAIRQDAACQTVLPAERQQPE